MPFDTTRLFEFLDVIDSELPVDVTLVAAGGTAMTLLELKPSTKDIDFLVPHNYRQFKETEQRIPHGYKIDAWPDGQVFSQQLPEDYLEKSLLITSNFTHITLKALHPIDIVDDC